MTNHNIASPQDFLKEIIFRKVSPTEDEWSAFIELWKPFKFSRNELITDFGAIENYFYFVNEGVIRGYFIKDGEDFNMGFSYQGDFSGVYNSFVSRKPADYAMDALTEVNGLRITHTDLMNLFESHKVFEKWGRLFNEMILVGLGIFVQSILADSAEERFRKLMKRSPHIIQFIPQKHLASYLGMTPETFSRMRKKWME